MAADFIYRSACLEDIEQIATAEEEIFTDAWSKRAFIDTLNTDNVSFVVATTVDNIIAGYCISYRSVDEAEIVNVAVIPKMRNKGIAWCMLRALIEQDKNAGISRFFLEVRESNMPARHLYEKLGFVKMGIRRNFYTDPRENAVIMGKLDLL